MTLYLADTSIWGWASGKERPDITTKLAERIQRGAICMCVPVALEVMHRASRAAEYDEIFGSLLEPLEWLPLDDRSAQRALEVQRQLASPFHGNHRRPAVDYLIAAIAELAGVVLWFFDKDLRIVCDHTGQPAEAEASTGPAR